GGTSPSWPASTTPAATRPTSTTRPTCGWLRSSSRRSGPIGPTSRSRTDGLGRGKLRRGCVDAVGALGGVVEHLVVVEGPVEGGVEGGEGLEQLHAAPPTPTRRPADRPDRPE